jgi:hypothetical protein
MSSAVGAHAAQNDVSDATNNGANDALAEPSEVAHSLYAKDDNTLLKLLAQQLQQLQEEEAKASSNERASPADAQRMTARTMMLVLLVLQVRGLDTDTGKSVKGRP